MRFCGQLSTPWNGFDKFGGRRPFHDEQGASCLQAARRGDKLRWRRSMCAGAHLPARTHDEADEVTLISTQQAARTTIRESAGAYATRDPTWPTSSISRAAEVQELIRLGQP